MYGQQYQRLRESVATSIVDGDVDAISNNIQVGRVQTIMPWNFNNNKKNIYTNSVVFYYLVFVLYVVISVSRIEKCLYSNRSSLTWFTSIPFSEHDMEHKSEEHSCCTCTFPWNNVESKCSNKWFGKIMTFLNSFSSSFSSGSLFLNI